MNPRAQLPAVSALAIALVGAWSYVLLFPAGGVSIANRTDQILRDVEICVQGGHCLNRSSLLPHEAWRVAPPGDGGCVEVRVAGERARQACVNVYDQPRVRLIVTDKDGIQVEE